MSWPAKANGAGAPSIYQPEYRNFAPHVGFDWNVGSDKKTVINGSASIIFDRTVITAIQNLQDADSYLFQQLKTLSNGNADKRIRLSFTTDPRLDGSSGSGNLQSHEAICGAPASPPGSVHSLMPLPRFAQDSAFPDSPCGLIDGSAFNSATIDPDFKTPYNMVFDFGVQRNLPWDMVLKATYVGRLGRRLLGQADAQQVIDFPDTKSAQSLSARPPRTSNRHFGKRVAPIQRHDAASRLA